MIETFIEELVTYTLEVEGKLVMVENVPARVCQETGERLFAPETVQHLYETVWGKDRQPKRTVQTQVYEYA